MATRVRPTLREIKRLKQELKIQELIARAAIEHQKEYRKYLDEVWRTMFYLAVGFLILASGIKVINFIYG